MRAFRNLKIMHLSPMTRLGSKMTIFEKKSFLSGQHRSHFKLLGLSKNMTSSDFDENHDFDTHSAFKQEMAKIEIFVFFQNSSNKKSIFSKLEKTVNLCFLRCRFPELFWGQENHILNQI